MTKFVNKAKSGISRSFSFVGKNKNGLKTVIIIVLIISMFTVFSKAIKNFLASLGLIDSPEEAARKKLSEQQLNGMIKGAEKDLGQLYKETPSTQNDAYWLQVADNIYEDLRFYYDFDCNYSDAEEQILKCKNDSDIFKLISSFGLRSKQFTFLDLYAKSLPSFVEDFSTSRKGRINLSFQNRGMKFQF